MMKKLTMMTAAVAIAAVSASASPVSPTVRNYPPVYTDNMSVTELPGQNGMIKRISPNLDKENGVLMYGATLADEWIRTHFVSFRSNEISKTFTRHIDWIETLGLGDASRKLYKPITGVYNPDDNCYYVMVMMMYDTTWGAGYMYNYCPDKWYCIDMTGEQPVAELLEDWEQYVIDMGWTRYSIDPNAPHWEAYTDMAYDPAKKRVMGMVQSQGTAVDIAHSAIGYVDLPDGQFHQITELKEYYLGFTYDADGNLYAARWTYGDDYLVTGSVIVKLDPKTFKETGVLAELTRDGAPFKLSYNGTMEIDRATGDIYFAGCEQASGRQYLFRINPDNGSHSIVGGFMFDNIVGLHIPYEGAEHREAPARVLDLKTAFDKKGAEKLTLTWTNPSTMWNRGELTSISGVRIYRDSRDSEPIADIKDAAPGSQSKYIDAGAKQGLHTYYVIPYNDKGAGVPDEIRAFAGHDVPGAPVDPGVATKDMLTVNLIWDEPSTGAHDGWFDSNSLTYSIVRYPDNKLIAENIENTRYNDETLKDCEMMSYTYEITAHSADGKGLSVMTKPIIAGAAVKTPVDFDFSNSSILGTFTPVNLDFPDGISAWTNEAWNKSWRIRTDSRTNDALYSPVVALKAGHTYRTLWSVSFNTATNMHNFRFTVGKEMKAENQKEYAAEEYDESELGSINQKHVFSNTFTVEEDGDYHLGLVLNSNYAQDDFLDATGLVVEEVFENDLRCTLLETIPRMSASNEAEQVFYVTVDNCGSNRQDNYKVQAGYNDINGKFIVLGETANVPALEPGDVTVVKVYGRTDVNNGMIIPAVGRVVLEGDMYADNDMCEPMDVKVDGTSSFNVRVTGMNKGTHTSLPFSTYSQYATTVTIYPSDYMDMKEDYESFAISRIGFLCNAERRVSDIGVKVYMGNTTRDEFGSMSPCEDPIYSTDLTLVYDGSGHAVEKGRGALVVDLDKKFEYDPSQNLVVMVSTDCVSALNEFPLFWECYDTDFDIDMFRSIKSSQPADDAYKFNACPGVPGLYLAGLGKTGLGVESVAAGGSLGVNVTDGVFRFFGNPRSVKVWNLAGSVVMSRALGGDAVVTHGLEKGVYVIGLTGSDGASEMFKVLVR